MRKQGLLVEDHERRETKFITKANRQIDKQTNCSYCNKQLKRSSTYSSEGELYCSKDCIVKNIYRSEK